MVAYKILTIGGITTLVIFLVRFFALAYVGEVISEQVEPELEKAFNQLNEKVICIPEASSKNHEICINNLGEVIINGNLEKSISISTNNGDFCYIRPGQYNYNNLCKLNNLNKATQIYVEDMQTQKTIIETTKIVSYINNLQNLKKPIKTGFWIFKKIKYIPI